MNILLLGSGGREHALGWKLISSALCKELHMAPGAFSKEPHFIDAPLDIMDSEAVAQYINEKNIDLLVIGPEAPLVAGLADRIRETGTPVFGPGNKGARLEGSKVFAKGFMERYKIPTARSATCRTLDQVKDHLKENPGPVVVKCDGLAAGKGVGVFDTGEEALEFSRQIFSGTFGSGSSILLEERLEGPEVSIFMILDGERYTLLAPSRDHKRAFDGDLGPNTGGMGAFTPVPAFGEELQRQVKEEILDQILVGLKAEKIPYRGLLYVGLMITEQGPKVLEFNVRFGDPETQPLMVAMDDDLLPWLYGAAKGVLPEGAPKFYDGVALTVVMAAENYPGAPVKGAPIAGLDAASSLSQVKVFHAGTRRREEEWIVAGGRVLGVTARGKTIAEARSRAYNAVQKITWPGAHYRSDIGETREK